MDTPRGGECGRVCGWGFLGEFFGPYQCIMAKVSFKVFARHVFSAPSSSSSSKSPLSSAGMVSSNSVLSTSSSLPLIVRSREEGQAGRCFPLLSFFFTDVINQETDEKGDQAKERGLPERDPHLPISTPAPYPSPLVPSTATATNRRPKRRTNESFPMKTLCFGNGIFVGLSLRKWDDE